MMKIFLASTNKIFINSTINDIRSIFPDLYNQQNIHILSDKERVLEIINLNNFDLLITDSTILNKNNIYAINRDIKGTVWLVDKKLSQEKISENIFIWNSHDEYKEHLLSLKQNFVSMTPIRNNHNNNNKNNTPRVKNEATNLTNNQRKILENQKEKDYLIEKKKEDCGKQEENQTVFIAPPYPNTIEKSVKYKMMETKELELDKDLEQITSEEKRMAQLEPLVREYFNLVTPKNFLKKTDKRLAATLDMYNYINFGQSPRHQTVGVWSPKQGIGVTTLVMNFALYIGQKKGYPISVMEGLKPSPNIYKELVRISPTKTIPTEWISYVKYTNERKKLNNTNQQLVESAIIDYKGVYWFPLKNNRDYLRSVIEDIPYYLSVTNPKDIVIIDLPNGELKRDTRKTIKHLKQLWILLDGSSDMILSYSKYVKQLHDENPQLSIYIILLDYFPIVTEKVIRENFSYPVITIMPDLNDEVRKNKYEHTTIIDNMEVEPLLTDAFDHIGSHLYEDLFTKNDTNLSLKNNEFIIKLINRIRKRFN